MRALAFVVFLASTARADETFRYDWSIDSAVSVVGLFSWLSSENAKKDLAATSCHWCERDAAGHPIVNDFDRAARDALRIDNTSAADGASTALGFALMPLFMVGSGLLSAGYDHRLKEYPVDLLLFAESAIIAADFNQAVKFAVGRERPIVHFTDGPDARKIVAQSDSLTSFYSGHTTLAFAMATSAGTIASMRHYRLAPLVWVLGVSVASLTGYLRVAADRHYMSDVLVGGAAGSLIGFVNPFFVHKKRWRPMVKSVADGAVLGVSGRF
jgi:membrane-associated phospholipid phosphatase